MKNKYVKAHMAVAHQYAMLSSAIRLQVGCIIVKDNRIISIGYNGMPTGWDNCCEDIIGDNNGTPVLKSKPVFEQQICVLKVALYLKRFILEIVNLF